MDFLGFNKVVNIVMELGNIFLKLAKSVKEKEK